MKAYLKILNGVDKRRIYFNLKDGQNRVLIFINWIFTRGLFIKMEKKSPA
jgi:hypothetical protein